MSERNNRSVRGADPTFYTISDLVPITTYLNGSFYLGAASTWARNHLVNGQCP